MSELNLQIAVGSTASFPLQLHNLGTTALPAFATTDTFSGHVYGDTATTPIFSPAVSWYTAGGTQTGYTQGQILVSVTALQSALLTAQGTYRLEVWWDQQTYLVARATITVLPAPGSVPSVPPDLITLDYALMALAVMNPTTNQRNFIPSAISAASNQIRRWCMGRNFDQRTYSAVVCPVALDGYIRLDQPPINQIISIQSQPQDALIIFNGNSSVQTALAGFTLTGDLEGGQTITGLTLTSVSNGTPTSSPVAFSAGETISALATAINAVGGGWSATADPILGAWPVTELDGGQIAQGCSGGAQAKLQVWSQYVTNTRFHPDGGQRTGLVWVGQRFPGLGPTWGPDWTAWDEPGTNSMGAVKVSYNGGFAVIPSIVQFACVETVKVMLQRLKINPYLVSERAGEVAYELATQALSALPVSVLQELSQYRIHNA